MPVVTYFLLVLSLVSLSSFASDAPGLDVITSRNGDIVSYRNWNEKNVSLIDWNNPIRNQGAVGSCQSFAFLGMIEGEVFRSQGVTLDLSERYQLYSNFMEFGALGSSPFQIAQFPNSFQKWGALPESLFPYNVVNKNAGVFEVDSAQGLQNTAIPQILLAIQGKQGIDRSLVLQKDEFLGPLPVGNYPVQLPVRVAAIDTARPARFVWDKQSKIEVSCFSTSEEHSGVFVSSSEFVAHCLEYTPDRFAVVNQVDILASRATKQKCSEPNGVEKLIEDTLLERRIVLQNILVNLEAKSPAMIAMSVPLTLEGKKSVLWDTDGKSVHAGHAVIVLGYLTAHDLINPDSQASGLLGSGLFDKLASKVDSSYTEPDHALSSRELSQIRSNSHLGVKIQKEQGILIFRNSWGDVPGLSGYQTMTFDYFLAHVMLTMTSTDGAFISSGQPPKINVDSIAHDSLLKEINEVFCPASR